MSSKLFKKIAAAVPPEIDLFTDKSMDIALRINDLMVAKSLSQKDLAAALGKSPSQISNWLAGNHNFTLKTITQLEVFFGASIIEPVKMTENEEVLFWKNLFTELQDKIAQKYATSKPLKQVAETEVIYQIK
jgi:transcriptional regulator with XRE-family HTH domain